MTTLPNFPAFAMPDIPNRDHTIDLVLDYLASIAGPAGQLSRQ